MGMQGHSKKSSVQRGTYSRSFDSFAGWDGGRGVVGVLQVNVGVRVLVAFISCTFTNGSHKSENIKSIMQDVPRGGREPPDYP